MYQICENCYEYDLVPGTTYTVGPGEYELEISEGFSAWERCPSCGIELNGDTERAQLSWSIDEPSMQEVSEFRHKRWGTRIVSPAVPSSRS